MIEPVLRRLSSSLRRSRLLDGVDALVIAVSGGPDSMALLHLLHEISRGRRRLVVGHVHHGIRGAEADRDAAFVEKQASALGLPSEIRRVRVLAGGNLEERAREARYRDLREIAREEGIGLVATGHTEDDQAETLLLRLFRGAGRGGLSGIDSKRPDGVIRPLLGISRAELVDFLGRRRIPYRRDRSNRDTRHTRNRIRRRVLPVLEKELGPGVSGVLARTAAILLEEDRWMDRLVSGAARSLTGPEGGLDVAGLLRLPGAQARRVVRFWLAGLRGDLRQLSATHIESVLAAARTDGARVSIPGGTIRRAGTRLVAGDVGRVQAFSARFDPGVLALPGGWELRRREAVRRDLRAGPWRALFDAATLSGGLRVRTPRAGDRVRPLGLDGSRKLQDVFVDAKVPREERSRWIVVTAGRSILWVPGLVRSGQAPIREVTRSIVVLEARCGQRGVAAQ